jgi:hypothetical protein
MTIVKLNFNMATFNPKLSPIFSKEPHSLRDAFAETYLQGERELLVFLIHQAKSLA